MLPFANRLLHLPMTTTATTAAVATATTTATTRRCSLISDAYKKSRLHAQKPCSQIAFAAGMYVCPLSRRQITPENPSNACFLLIAIAVADIYNSTHIHNQKEPMDGPTEDCQYSLTPYQNVEI